MKKIAFIAIIALVASIAFSAGPVTANPDLQVKHTIEAKAEAGWNTNDPSTMNIDVALSNIASAPYEITEGQDTYYALVRTNSRNSVTITLSVDPLALTDTDEGDVQTKVVDQYYPMTLEITSTTYVPGENGALSKANATNATVASVEVTNVTEKIDVSEKYAEGSELPMTRRIVSNAVSITLGDAPNQVAGTYVSTLTLTASVNE